VLKPFAYGIVAAVVVGPSLVFAQSGDALPFRPQQWGVEFGVGGNFASAGVLRFQTAQRALLMDVQGNVTRVSPADESDALMNASGAVRLGVRRYRSIRPVVVGFSTFGASISAARTNEFASTPSGTSTDPAFLIKSTDVGAGVFADLGATWMVAPNLSLGAVWTATLDYTRIKTERMGGTGTSDRVWLRFGTVGVRGTLYF